MESQPNAKIEVIGKSRLGGVIMSQLAQIFNYQGRDVRTVNLSGVIWFVVADVCRVLGLSNPTEAIRALDDDERMTLRISEGGPEANVINEPGLYTLILRSNKYEAKEFKRWVTHEVLPAIKKHGGYLTPETVEAALLNPDTIIRLATSLKEERERRQVAEIMLQEVAPKVEFYEAVSASNDLISMSEAAKILNYDGIGQNNLFRILRGCGVFKEGTKEPKQEHVSNGRFVFKEYPFQAGGRERIGKKAYVTQKGLKWIKKVLDAEGYRPLMERGA